MLVKIIAMGLSPALWKNVFHHFRNALPKHPFAAGIFSTPEEIDFLIGEFHPARWRREEVDFILCEAPARAEWKKQLPLLKRLTGKDAFPAVNLIMTLSTLENGIKQVVSTFGPVVLQVDRKLRFTLSDPDFILSNFPADFPRVQVNGLFSALRLKSPRRGAEEITAGSIPINALVGFSEIEAFIADGEALAPEQWLREVLKAEKVKLPRGGSPGLIQESNGLFLCPGLPLGRITGVEVDGIRFSHLLDLGQLSKNSAHFAGVRDSLRKAGNRHQRRWRETTRLIRIAESKTDLPLVCGGGLPLVRESLSSLLKARGFRRCAALEALPEGALREPAMVLQVGPWAGGRMEAQIEDPLVISLEADLETVLGPLDTLMAWRELAFRPLSAPDIPLNPKTFAEQRETLDVRSKKAGGGIDLAENRALMLRQETAVLDAARVNLNQLLEARETVQVWSGTVPPSMKQAVVFSHDAEEAGAVLQALSGIAKKRWFDLSAFTTPDTLQNLSLGPLRQYLDQGMMVITAASRERLKALRVDMDGQAETARRSLDECRTALEFYRQENEKIAAATEQLARQWVHDSLDDWLERNMGALLDQLELLRRRHERSWFAPALVSRLAAVSSNGENRAALLSACREVYPAFKPDHSWWVERDFQPLHRLPPEERKALAASGREEPPPDEAGGREEQALWELNQTRLEGYLQGISLDLGEAKVDLLIIEQERETAFALLERLRTTAPMLAETPAILILPDYWTPKENQPLPWPLTRVICMRRLGGLAPEDCQRHLQALYAQ